MMTTVGALLLALGASAYGQQPSPPPTFEDVLKKIASAPANACEDRGPGLGDLESRLFEQADDAVAQNLNEQSSASAALEVMEHLSSEINQSWPAEKRFHFQVLDVPPALLVKMTYRNRATFSFFAIPELDASNQPNRLWHTINADDYRLKPSGGYDSLDLFPLGGGPAKRARFLARFGTAGCGSGKGVAYHAYEWNPQNTGDINRFIKLEGAVSHYDLNAIGTLQTQGSIIALPYCWFSSIDTLDNPTLCALNSYDISRDRVRFVSTAYNLPDLLPVAKAIEYAQARDYPAVLAYCGSADVARRMVTDVPPFLSAGGGLTVKPISASKKRVEIGDERTLQFDVEKRGDRWLVVSFHMD